MEIFEGVRVGYVTVLKQQPTPPNGVGSKWVCRCVCGRRLVAKSSELKARPTINCGCQSERLRRDGATTHGQAAYGSVSKEYKAWSSMKDRCTRKTHRHYAALKARGITVCPEWLASFEAFLRDMGECPSGQMLGRKDSGGSYTADNCRWVPRSMKAIIN